MIAKILFFLEWLYGSIELCRVLNLEYSIQDMFGFSRRGGGEAHFVGTTWSSLICTDFCCGVLQSVKTCKKPKPTEFCLNLYLVIPESMQQFLSNPNYQVFTSRRSLASHTWTWIGTKLSRIYTMRGLVLPERRCLTFMHLWVPIWASPCTKRVFKLHLPFSWMCQTWPYLKLTYSSSALFKLVEDLKWHILQVYFSNRLST